ncbi:MULTISPECIES: MAB_1171c family putative transporter [unclassified Pseudonocardia]|uniref:MAB_1171c family putative transporter n=1 Tax=unclassified Pseudonocardia TaxID=2619320 RepID=UPI00094B4009|nr:MULTISPECIES: MAB_1171c family putative transporter [unclassified Pseudonocardia]
MTTFYAALALVATCGLLWALTQVGRLTRAPRLLALTGLMIFWAGSWPFGLIANAGTGALGLDRLDARTIEHALRLVATACLLAFILATPRPRRAEPTGRVAAVWWWQAAALVVAVVALVLNSAWTPAELRDSLAGMANGDAVSGAGPVGATSAALFFLIENVYYLVAFAIATVWVTGHLRREPLPPALRRGLRLLWLGSTVLVLATAVLSVSVVVRWSGVPPPPALNGLGLVLLAVGLLVVVLGLAAPAAASLGVMLRIVGENWAAARELEPLWSELREVFPREDAPVDRGEDGFGGLKYTATTDAATSPVAARLSRRFYRKVIDCRDRLHLLSPYLQEITPDGQGPSDLPTGAQLLAALDLRRARTLDYADSPVVGRPDDAVGFDDDVQVLVLLSRRLVAAQRADGRLVRASAR